MTKLIAYYRVSTKKQQASGLGLEAQKDAVYRYAQQNGLEVVGVYQETESGKNHENRPELRLALEQCELTGAKLVIAKLDRLSRNVAFLANLMESRVQFVACDNPQANELTIHILAAVAQEERRAISQRTKAALAAAKARGVQLGNPRLEKARAAREIGSETKAANIVRQQKAHNRAVKIMHAITKINSKGVKSLQGIADYLNQQTHIRTARNRLWTRTAISRVMLQAQTLG